MTIGYSCQIINPQTGSTGHYTMYHLDRARRLRHVP
jgi:hypothetical protein